VSTDSQHGPGARASVLRQVSVTICPDQQTLVPDSGLPMIYQRTLRAAARAAEQARLQAFADAAAGGCAHALASPAYQPPPLLRPPRPPGGAPPPPGPPPAVPPPAGSRSGAAPSTIAPLATRAPGPADATSAAFAGSTIS